MKRVCHALTLSTCLLATAGHARAVDLPLDTSGDLGAMLAALTGEDLLPAPLDPLEQTHGFRLDRDRDIRDLGSIAAHGSNEAGLVVGEAPVPGGTHAMLWPNGGQAVDLGDLPGGDISAVARAVDATGRIVGRAHAEDGDRAFVWTEATGMLDLTELADLAPGVILRDATAIDATGRIVGRATVNDVETVFAWMPETGILELADAQPGIRDRVVELSGLAAEGPAVGRALTVGGRDRPVAWFPGERVVDLGDLPGGRATGRAHDIDSLGWIVGSSAAEDGDRAFVWQPETGMVDLNELIPGHPDIVLTAAVSIIEDGRILAYGLDGDDVHFYRLVPVLAQNEADRPDLVGAKGVADLMDYDVTDLGVFAEAGDGVPILAMDETGRVVGACDVLAPACPSTSDLILVTNLSTSGPDRPDLFPTDPEGPSGSPDPRTPPPDIFVILTPENDPGLTNGFETDFFVNQPRSGPDDDEDDGTPPGGPEAPAPVPLPAPWLSLMAALGLLGLLRRRRAV